MTRSGTATMQRDNLTRGECRVHYAFPSAERRTKIEPEIDNEAILLLTTSGSPRRSPFGASIHRFALFLALLAELQAALA